MVICELKYRNENIKKVKNWIKVNKLAYFLDDRYLSSEDTAFVDLVTADLEQFQAQSLNKVVLLFPPVNSYQRLLIHKTVEDFPGLKSFSVGEGERRQTVVCLTTSFITREPEKPEKPEEDNPLRPQIMRGRGRGYRKDRNSPSPSPGQGHEDRWGHDLYSPELETWRHPQDLHQGDGSPRTGSPHTSITPRVGSTTHDLQQREGSPRTGSPHSQGTSVFPRGRGSPGLTPGQTSVHSERSPAIDLNTADKTRKPERSKNRRPDVQVYVPRARRQAAQSGAPTPGVLPAQTSAERLNSEPVTQEPGKPLSARQKRTDIGPYVPPGRRMDIDQYVPPGRRSQHEQSISSQSRYSPTLSDSNSSTAPTRDGNSSEWTEDSSTSNLQHYVEFGRDSAVTETGVISDDTENVCKRMKVTDSEPMEVKPKTDYTDHDSSSTNKCDTVNYDLVDQNLTTNTENCTEALQRGSDTDCLNASAVHIKTENSYSGKSANNSCYIDNSSKISLDHQNQQSGIDITDQGVHVAEETLITEPEPLQDTGNVCPSGVDTVTYVIESNVNMGRTEVLEQNDTEVKSEHRGPGQGKVLTKSAADEEKFADAVSEEDMCLEQKQHTDIDLDKPERSNSAITENRSADNAVYTPEKEENTIADSETDDSGEVKDDLDVGMDLSDSSNEKSAVENSEKIVLNDLTDEDADKKWARKISKEIVLNEMTDKNADEKLAVESSEKIVLNETIAKNADDAKLLFSNSDQKKFIKTDVITFEDDKDCDELNKHQDTINREAMEEVEEDSWDAMFDDDGECLDPAALEELSKTVGKVKIQKSKNINYLNYEPKDKSNFDYSQYEHIIEIYGFPAEFVTRDLISAFKDFMSRGFDLKWVDDTHALGIFSSAIAAQDALNLVHPLLKVCPLSQASKQSQSKAKRCTEFLQPYKPRPETTAAAARRLVAGALGIATGVSKEKREKERQQLKEAKAKKRQERQNREDIWEYGKCAMDQES